ncbi:MAG: DNA alkylation repair protein [Flavobacterium sp. BFFFF2]|nr:MAG: DNA alkylation repair protein [Flavobacterium sp. BFFFF2]
MKTIINDLISALHAAADAERAVGMTAYMKYNFPFLGIQTPIRRRILKVWNQQHAPEIKNNVRAIVRALWQLPEREFHYCAVDLLVKNLKNKWEVADELLIYELLTTHAWWDTVDLLAKYGLGGYLQQFPEKRDLILESYLASDQFWLQRSTLIFQLDYKSKTDVELLKALSLHFKGDKEFFIRKAIGWAWREYARVNPELVRQWIPQSGLSPLSVREAMKHL